jgi:hypothetical protein
MRLLLTIDGLPGWSAPVELPDGHEIVQHARQYAEMRATGDAEDHVQAAVENDIASRVRVEIAANAALRGGEAVPSNGVVGG